MKNTINKINNLSRNKKVGLSAVAAALLAGGLVIGCGGGGDTATSNFVATADPVIAGTDLFCDGIDVVNGVLLVSKDAADYNESTVTLRNVSANGTDDAARVNPNANNTLVRMGMAMAPLTSSGAAATLLDTNETKVRPLLISYAEQTYAVNTFTSTYELGDGSADIGDPTHVDDIFVSLSRDDGQTWKKYQLSDFAEKVRSSIDVQWDLTNDDTNTTQLVPYPGHNVKPTMVVSGNNILVAWHSKYCPSGNPLGLTQTTTDTTTTYPTDYFQVNGSQGSIDYTDKDGTIMVAPNGKKVFEVPFSCIWTARGIFDANNTTDPITWMKPQQLTSGTRDAAKVTIAESVPGAGSEAGFAITWQEDTEGLRSGKGEGPGDGWSGATTNHGSDIWYSMITAADFSLTDGTVTDIDGVSKLKPLVNFSYPVRITDNEMCKVGDTKLYCQALCEEFGSEDGICKTGDSDMLDGERVNLNGDTGASRPIIRLLKTNTDTNEYAVVLGYEETKGLSEKATQDTTTDIALEGKSVYFESFPFKKVELPTTEDNFRTLVASLPMVSSGNIINVKAPREGTTTDMIYENARRLTFIPQINPCDDGTYTYGFLYKQGFDTQGTSSDMFVRMNTGFGYDTLKNYTPVNVSAQTPTVDGDGNVVSTWSTANLDDNTYDNKYENTFSPRGFIRGNDIYIGYEYNPDAVKNVAGHVPNNFFVHRYTGGEWQGPQNITQMQNNSISTLDPRFVATPKGRSTLTGLESDVSNPDVMFVTFGTFDMATGLELDLYYTRSTDKGVTWETPMTTGVTTSSILSKHDGVESKEVQTLSTPDGKRLFNAWLQESTSYISGNPFSGLDTWFGRVNYVKSVIPE